MKNNIKHFLLKIWDWYVVNQCWIKTKKTNPVIILNTRKTIDYVKKHNCSIARYGDGEFDLMYKGNSEDYQKFSNELSVALIKVLENSSKNLLICIPYPMICVKGLKKHAKRFWKMWVYQGNGKITKNIVEKTGKNYVFGDSFVSRPYTAYKSRKKAKKAFSLLRDLWKDKEILIVEGELTRMGVGNDLFSNAKSIKRILAPAENCFDSYSDILKSVLDVWNGELVIMALGPTATILASDLSKEGIQALDLGHIDIQYEWFLHGNDFKPIAGKYTNEAAEKPKIDECLDEEYLSQIVTALV